MRRSRKVSETTLTDLDAALAVMSAEDLREVIHELSSSAEEPDGTSAGLDNAKSKEKSKRGIELTSIPR